MDDRYGNRLTTSSQAAADAYVAGVDLFLSAQGGAEDAFARAIAADPGFALAHVALARELQVQARPAEARAAMARAPELSGGLTDREAGHLHVLGLLIDGDARTAHTASLVHLEDHPRDALVLQINANVYGLIGFSGRVGREALNLAHVSQFARHYGADWWYQTTLAFARCETGLLDEALDGITRALEARPGNAHAAHVHAHVHYERGDMAASRAAAADWRPGYERGGILHCHLAWHEAIIALAAGERDHAWTVYEAEIRPAKASGPPLIVLPDCVGFLLRDLMYGGDWNADLWREASDYAIRTFARPGLSFGDAHGVIAHAMAKDTDRLAGFRDNPPGYAGDMVAALGAAFAAFAQEDWPEVVARLTPIMAHQERLGGSRAQRDLLELTMIYGLVRQDRVEEARRLLRLRRPNAMAGQAIAGL